MPRPEISVIIPHLNQPGPLAACLASLMRQQGAFSLAEVLVVDNGSNAPPTALCAGFANVTLLNQSEPGPGPARNLGVARAKGAIVAFIDADCSADPGWLAAISAAFADPAVMLLGGDVQIPRQPGRKTSMLEAYESIYAYRMQEYIAKQGFTGTGNLALRRSVFTQVGPFGSIHLAEDRDWGQRASALGFRPLFVPEMLVFHPARATYGDLAQKWNRSSAHDFQLYRARPFGRLRWFLRAMAVAGSPLFELGRILGSNRVSGLRERMLALFCLIRIRLHRAKIMLWLLLGGDDKALSGAWNRG